MGKQKEKYSDKPFKKISRMVMAFTKPTDKRMELLNLNKYLKAQLEALNEKKIVLEKKK